MPKEIVVKTKPRPGEEGGGIVIRNPKRKCRNIDSDYFEADCVGTGTARDLVTAGIKATEAFRKQLDIVVNAVRDAASAWGAATQCKQGCKKTGYITSPADWDFPTTSEDLSNSPRSFTITISTEVRCWCTVLCE